MLTSCSLFLSKGVNCKPNFTIFTGLLLLGCFAPSLDVVLSQYVNSTTSQGMSPSMHPALPISAHVRKRAIGLASALSKEILARRTPEGEVLSYTCRSKENVNPPKSVTPCCAYILFVWIQGPTQCHRTFKPPNGCPKPSPSLPEKETEAFSHQRYQRKAICYIQAWYCTLLLCGPL